MKNRFGMGKNPRKNNIFNLKLIIISEKVMASLSVLPN